MKAKNIISLKYSIYLIKYKKLITIYVYLSTSILFISSAEIVKHFCDSLNQIT